MHTTLILPAYNESRHIAKVLEAAVPLVDRVIVIDNASIDNTAEVAQGFPVAVVRHGSNLGKSASLKTGCELALSLGTDVLAFMDSDGQHRPEDLPRFFEALEQPGVDMVIGARLENRDQMPWVRRLGNGALGALARLLYGVRMQDLQSGFRVFHSAIYSRIAWQSSGDDHYFADAEISCRLGREKLAFLELPIDTIFHEAHKGMTFIEGLQLLTKLVIWRFTCLRP